MASNLLAAPLLFFALGVLARVLRSDLGIPAALTRALSIYLLAGIGLHGGAELARGGLAEALAPAAAALGLAVAIPLLAYALLRRVLRVGGFDAAAIAAHYGSVSVATFLAAAAYVHALGYQYEPATVLMLALMEAPAIVIGLALAVRLRGNAHGIKGAFGQALTHGSVVLLLGTMAIGALATPASLEAVKPFFQTLFMGALCLFLVQLGVDAAAAEGGESSGGAPYRLRHRDAARHGNRGPRGRPLRARLRRGRRDACCDARGKRLLYRGPAGDAPGGAGGQSFPLSHAGARGDVPLQPARRHPRLQLARLEIGWMNPLIGVVMGSTSAWPEGISSGDHAALDARNIKVRSNLPQQVTVQV